MTVSYENSRLIFQGIKAAGITSLSALPETWLGLLLQQAERDPEVTMIQVAKEEEAIGIAAGAYFAGQPHVLLMQNHGFLAAINGIVSLAQLYGIPLCMLIALRGHWGEPYAWHTRGGIVPERVVVLDGDGAVLMNLGTLATIARYRPRNLVHIIFDNGSLLSTGGFDSHTTSGTTDLAAIARGAGLERVAAVDSVVDFGEAVIENFSSDELS